MRYVYYLIEIGDALALISVLVLLLRGPTRKFWALLVYVTWELLANVALSGYDLVYNAALVDAGASAPTVKLYARLYSRLYWTNDVIVDVLRFLLVIWLTYRATSGGPKRTSIGRILSGIVVVALALPFLLFPMFPMGPKAWPEASWFNSTSELLNFGAAIMNLVLWGVLLADRKRDPQLAVVSVGLGVVVTGAAISYGLRHLIPAEARFIPNMFLMLTQLAGWFIWSRAFWTARARGTALDPAPGNLMPPA
jgi:hypothetical protein